MCKSFRRLLILLSSLLLISTYAQQNAQLCESQQTDTYNVDPNIQVSVVRVMHEGINPDKVRVQFLTGSQLSATVTKSASNEQAMDAIDIAWTHDEITNEVTLFVNASFDQPQPTSPRSTDSGEEYESGSTNVKFSPFLMFICVTILFGLIGRDSMRITLAILILLIATPCFIMAVPEPDCMSIDVQIFIPPNSSIIICINDNCEEITVSTTGITDQDITTSGTTGFDESTTGVITEGPLATTGDESVSEGGSGGSTTSISETGSASETTADPSSGTTTGFVDTTGDTGSETTGGGAETSDSGSETGDTGSSETSSSSSGTSSSSGSSDTSSPGVSSGTSSSGSSETSSSDSSTSGTSATSSSGGTSGPISPTFSISGTSPSEFCYDSFATHVLIYGTGLSTATVKFEYAENVMPYIIPSINSRTDTVIDVAVYWGPYSGFYHLIVERSDRPDPIIVPNYYHVRPPLYIFSSDPRSLYNGIDLQMTFLISGTSGRLQHLRISGPQDTILDYQSDYIIQQEGSWSKASVIVPKGIPSGVYSVSIIDSIGCPTQTSGLFQVNSQLSFAVNHVDPPFAWQYINTGIQIFGQNFQSVPKVYISPNPPIPGQLAVPLRAVVWIDSTRLQAVVPSGLTHGTYDVVVINPDATIGLLTMGLKITQLQPPFIKAMVPGFLNTNQPIAVKIYGNGFDSQCTLSLHCQIWTNPSSKRDYSGSNYITVTSRSDTLIQATMGGVPDDNVCLVRVTNSDGAYFEYQAIVTRNPANKMKEWLPFSQELVEARRGSSATTVSVTTSSKYLYVVGGDNGTLAGAKSTVESSQLDKFGNLQMFVRQRYSLPRRLTFGQLVKVNRFLYYIGGYDPYLSGPSNQVYRAEVLDPFDTPTLSVDILVVNLLTSKRHEESTHLFESGTYYYSVSAVFGLDDMNNPGGESLPGEVLTIYLPPAVQNTLLRVRLSWNSIPDAVGYKVYRTPYSNMNINHLELIAVLDGVHSLYYTDTGLPSLEPIGYPLTIGSTGVWHPVKPMKSDRWGHVATASPIPYLENEFMIHALGGRDANGNLGNYEGSKIIVYGRDPYSLEREKQHVTDWNILTGSTNFPAKFMAAAARVGGEDLDVLDFTESAVIMGPGRTNSAYQSTWNGIMVANDTSGDFASSWQSSNDPPSKTMGYCLFQAFGLVHIIGGADGGSNFPSTSIPSYARVLPNPGLCNNHQTRTNIFGCSNWAGNPKSSIARAYPACGKENALFFLIGGVSSGNPAQGAPPTKQVLRTPQ